MFARAAGPGRGRLLAAALSNTQPAAPTPTAAGIFSRDPIAVSDHITLCHAPSAVLTSGAGRTLHPGLGSVSLRDKFDLFRSPGPHPSQTWTLPCTDQTKPAALAAKLLSITKAKYFQRNRQTIASSTQRSPFPYPAYVAHPYCPIPRESLLSSVVAIHYDYITMYIVQGI